MTEDQLREELLPEPAALRFDENDDEQLEELDALNDTPLQTWRDYVEYLRKPWRCGVSRVRVNEQAVSHAS